MNDNHFTNFKNGALMWHDAASSHGIDEAMTICGSYLKHNLGREISSDEQQFCRELFGAIYEATADRVDPSKLVYPYDFKTADDRMEVSCYHTSRKLNVECAHGINLLIGESYYKSNHYNLELAAMNAIHDYGFSRVCLVLAFNYQFKSNEGRFSQTNRKWADGFIVFGQAFDNTWLHSHPTLINSFCDYVRELYQNLDAERFELPGNKEHGEFVKGYEILQAITTSDDDKGFSAGFAIGHNPEAVSPWACWQFAIRDGKRHYNWGIYGEDRQTAIDAYNARIFAALN